jgi:dTMP kinase
MREALNTVQRRFITFEGIDGAGKSSHLQTLAQWLHARGQSVIVTREPGGNPIAETLRTLLLAQSMHRDTEALLMFAARNEHIQTLILPALEQGSWVLCDRFTDSTLAYQGGGKGADLARLRALARWVQGELTPGRTYIFDIEAQLAAARRTASRTKPDKFEREEQGFFERVIHSYRTLAQAEPGRCKVVDASQSMDTVKQFLLNDISIYAEIYLK